ncbi:MAG: hypothetical protein BWX84_02861 [Verrucomicrobia bacterium ADurb.Bin118]|nr:MAG: hypothetical protein BWX84_02861 [Verrucomicrobia bacterium ADurb.Bin118]
MAALYSLSLIQKGRPNAGAPSGPRRKPRRRGGGGAFVSPRLVVSGADRPGTDARSEGGGGAGSLPGGNPRGGGRLVPNGGNISSRGSTSGGRALSASAVRFVPRSTRFINVTVSRSQCTPVGTSPFISKSIGAPAEATTSPAALSIATAASSSGRINSRSAVSKRFLEMTPQCRCDRSTTPKVVEISLAR